MRPLKYSAALVIVLILLIWILNTYIKLKANTRIYADPAKVPQVELVLVPGASVYRSGDLSPILKYRVETAIQFFLARDSLPLLFTGHSIKGGYNEPVAMKDFSLPRGIPQDLILLDEKGTSTYTSLVNVKKRGRFKSILIVSQNFHLPRALLIAANLDLEAYGLVAPGSYTEERSGIHTREIFSRFKDLFLIKFFKLFNA